MRSVISGKQQAAVLYLPLRHSLLRAGASAVRAVRLQWASHTEERGGERESAETGL